MITWTKPLGCVNLQCSAEDDADHTFAKISCISEKDLLNTEEEFGVEPYCSIKSKIHLVSEKLAFQPFSDGVARPLRRFNTNTFCRSMS